jgi:surfactin synthase thioesterase subunit
MPLSAQELDAMRDEAASIAECELPPVELELMTSWKRSTVARYFESGGLWFPETGQLLQKRTSSSLDAIHHNHGVKYVAKQHVRTKVESLLPHTFNVLVLPENAEADWCKQLLAALDADDVKVTVCTDAHERILLAHGDSATHSKLLGSEPERTILIGSGAGATYVLRLLESRQLGGGLLIGVGGRSEAKWEVIQRNAGPLGGNLACVGPPPAMGAGGVPAEIGRVGLEKLGWAAYAAMRGATEATPKGVRVFALTMGLTETVYSGWSFPSSISFVPLRSPSGTSGVIAIARELAKELVSKHPSMLNLPSIIVGHDLGAWVAYELVSSLAAQRASAPEGTTWLVPSVMIVSGMRAPHLYDSRQHEADRIDPLLAGLDSASFYAAFQRRYGLDPALAADAALREHFEPELRKLAALTENYRPSGGSAALVAAAAAKDAVAKDAVVRGLDSRERRKAERADPFRPTAAELRERAEAISRLEFARPIWPSLRVVACAAMGDERLLPYHLESWRGYAGWQAMSSVAPVGIAGKFAGDDDAAFASVEIDEWHGTLAHRYILESPKAFRELVAAEATLLGFRQPLTKSSSSAKNGSR